MAYLSPDQQRALAARLQRQAAEREARMVQALRSADGANLRRLRLIADECSDHAAAIRAEAEAWAHQLVPRLYREGVANVDVAFARRIPRGRALRLAGEAHTRASELRVEAFLDAVNDATRSAERSVIAHLRTFTDAEIKSGLKGVRQLASVSDLNKALARGRVIAYVDSGGRAWGITGFVGTTARTEVRDALKDGFTNRMREFGLDLVQVSQHDGACELCLPWEGEYLSLDGETEGYATVADAEAAGLMHPNCYHNYEPVTASERRLVA